MTNESLTWFRHVRSHPSLAATLLVAGYAGLVGIDFGSHWDEPTLLRVVSDALTRGELLPRWYNYPSVSFDLSLLGGASEALSRSPSLRGSTASTGALATLVWSHGFLVRTRAVFFLVSLLTVVWVYWLAWDAGKSRLEATVAGGLVAFSWEIGYHARWIAPDAVMMQFGALSLLCMHLALSRSSARWSWAVAGAAGLACGTKYPGGALLLPVCLCAGIIAHEHRRGAVGILRGAAGALAVFVLPYLVTTPGTLFEYARFFTDVRREYAHYHEHGHPGGHSIRAGLPHLRAACEYVFCAALGRNEVVLFYASEAVASNELVASHHDTALRWFGAYEVNYNYYPTWTGRDRIVAMALPTARALFPQRWAARENDPL